MRKEHLFSSRHCEDIAEEERWHDEAIPRKGFNTRSKLNSLLGDAGTGPAWTPNFLVFQNRIKNTFAHLLRDPLANRHCEDIAKEERGMTKQSPIERPTLFPTPIKATFR